MIYKTITKMSMGGTRKKVDRQAQARPAQSDKKVVFARSPFHGK